MDLDNAILTLIAAEPSDKPREEPAGTDDCWSPTPWYRKVRGARAAKTPSFEVKVGARRAA